MHRHLAHALGATALATLLLQPVTTLADPAAQAGNQVFASYRDYDHPQYDERDGHWDEYNHDHRVDCDHRHRSPNYYHYPRPGYVVYRLPPGLRVVHHHGYRYYYGRGVWYRPYGRRYIVVEPPYRGW